MKEILQAIAAANGWPFEYGRRDFQNLHDEIEEDTSYLFVDPITITDIVSDSDVTEEKQFDGSMMLVRSSDIDEGDYETRYTEHIKPIIDVDIDLLKNALRCDYMASFVKWQTTEIINVLDYNFDGVLISFTLKIDED